MSGYKMHIAQRGKKAGQWVRCTAKGKCRVGGNHISSETIKAFIALSNKLDKTVPQAGDFNYEEYVQWKENEAKNPTIVDLNSKEKPLIAPFKKGETKVDPQTVVKALQKHGKTEEEKQADLNKLFIQPATNADEVDANYAIEHNLDGKTNVLLAISLTHSQWMKFLSKSYKLGVDIPLDFVKQGGANFRAGNSVFEAILPLRGNPESLKELSQDTGL